MGYLNTKEVCAMLHIGRKKAYDLFNVKGFPSVKIGRDYIVDEEELKEFLKMYKGSAIDI